MVSLHSAAKPLSHRERSVFIKLVSQLRSDADMRLRLQTKLISISVALTFIAIGSGFAFAEKAAVASPSAYRLVLNLEGSLRVHGAIMLGCGAFVLYTCSNYRRASRWALVLMGFYALLTACLTTGGWFIGKVSWPLPWWYVLMAALCLIMVRVSPPVNIGRSARVDRSERA